VFLELLHHILHHRGIVTPQQVPLPHPLFLDTFVSTFTIYQIAQDSAVLLILCATTAADIVRLGKQLILNVVEVSFVIIFLFLFVVSSLNVKQFVPSFVVYALSTWFSFLSQFLALLLHIIIISI
jgi:hypothetical protein